MTTPQPPTGDWHLIAWESYEPETKQHTTQHLRRARPGELDALGRATGLLNGFLANSAYADFTKATDKLHGHIEVLEQSWENARGTTPEQALAEVEHSVGNWLGAVRSYDDRTSKWISKWLGKGVVYDAFKGELSAEYDRNFAYRLSYALRNASEHQGNPLNHVRFQGRELPDGGRAHLIELGFDAPKLATTFTKLKGSIRQELTADGGLLSLEAVVGQASQTVERAFLTALLAAEPDLDVALQMLEGLQAEAEQIGAAAAHFMTSLADLTKPGQVQLRWVPIHTARTVRANMEVARAIMSLPPQVIQPADLAL